MKSLSERMYWACADALTLATQLSQAPDLPTPEVLRQRIHATLEALRTKAAQADIPSGDAMEAIYAIAAFMDEQILRSPWPGRQQWLAQPLQLVYFKENTAGEGFFHRLAALEADPERAHIVQIYYLCMSLGFMGRYATAHPQELAMIQERSALHVGRKLPGSETFSPAGYPARRQLALSARKFPVLGAALAFLGASVVLYLVFLLIIGLSASGAAERIRSTAAAAVGAKD